MVCWLFAIIDAVGLCLNLHTRWAHGVSNTFSNKDDISRSNIHQLDLPLFKFCTLTIMTYLLRQTYHISLLQKTYLPDFSLGTASHNTSIVTH
jgi:hypothetical protein